MASRSTSKASNDPYLDRALGFARRWATPLAIISILCAGGFFLWILSASAYAETLIGRVIGVSDGDTITVLDDGHLQHKIRLMGIDAPEKAQPFGNRAKQNMSDLIFGKSVSVEWTKHDRYGRIVGKVWVAPSHDCPDSKLKCPKTLDAGLAMITTGLAWHYKQYEKEQTLGDRTRYAYAETAARSNKAGLWGDRSPIPPWEWRHKKRDTGPN